MIGKSNSDGNKSSNCNISNYNNNNHNDNTDKSNNHNISINTIAGASSLVPNILCSITNLRSSPPDSNHEVDGPPAASSDTDNI